MGLTGITLTVCASCPAGRGGLAERLRDALAAAGEAVDLREVDCMSGRTRPSTIAVRAEGKTAYLFGDITAADLPDILTFLALYRASPDGNFADARPLGALRLKALARIPG